jgi:hypothetical protein
MKSTAGVTSRTVYKIIYFLQTGYKNLRSQDNHAQFFIDATMLRLDRQDRFAQWAITVLRGKVRTVRIGHGMTCCDQA